MDQSNFKEMSMKFWFFFTEISSKLKENPEDDNVVLSLDRAVQELGVYGWEYGPFQFKEGDYYFCLSPNLSVRLLEEVQYIISLAPALEGWHFLVGKPKKLEEINSIDIDFDKSSKKSVCADKWRCILYKVGNGKYEVDIQLDNEVNSFNENDQYIIVDTFLVQMLGEIGYMTYIEEVFIVEDIKKTGIKFLDLRYFFEELMEGG